MAAIEETVTQYVARYWGTIVSSLQKRNLNNIMTAIDPGTNGMFIGTHNEYVRNKIKIF